MANASAAKSGRAAQGQADRAFELAVSGGSYYPGPATARSKLAQEFSDVSTDEYAEIYFAIYD